MLFNVLLTILITVTSLAKLVGAKVLPHLVVLAKGSLLLILVLLHAHGTVLLIGLLLELLHIKLSKGLSHLVILTKRLLLLVLV